MITLGQPLSDNVNRLMTKSDLFLIQNTLKMVTLDLVNLRQIDRINQMITLSVNTLSGFQNIKKKIFKYFLIKSTSVSKSLDPKASMKVKIHQDLLKLKYLPRGAEL